jgi:hypothetical protein
LSKLDTDIEGNQAADEIKIIVGNRDEMEQ